MLNIYRLQVINWLWVCVALVFSMVILGGAVRLTGSGLSMTDWKLLLGIIPPLTHDAWVAAFAQYQQFPEYQLVNKGMSLGGFQFIYLMEYFHRLLGRIVGLVFFVPFMIFLFRGVLPDWLKSRLWFALLLGACQGLMGWYMVKSGLVDDPHVSQYRLTAHLLLAVIIYAWLLRLIFGLKALGVNAGSETRALTPLDRTGLWVSALVLLMIATGGFMAGTKAGFIFNTWPKTGHQWMPDMLLSLQPVWRNLFENQLTIQFVHRWLAVVVLVVVMKYAFMTIRNHGTNNLRLYAKLAAGFVILQVLLGIATLLARVPVHLGVTHQGVGLLVLGAVIAVACLRGRSTA